MRKFVSGQGYFDMCSGESYYDDSEICENPIISNSKLNVLINCKGCGCLKMNNTKCKYCGIYE